MKTAVPMLVSVRIISVGKKPNILSSSGSAVVLVLLPPSFLPAAEALTGELSWKHEMLLYLAETHICCRSSGAPWSVHADP